MKLIIPWVVSIYFLVPLSGNAQIREFPPGELVRPDGKTIYANHIFSRNEAVIIVYWSNTYNIHIEDLMEVLERHHDLIIGRGAKIILICKDGYFGRPPLLPFYLKEHMVVFFDKTGDFSRAMSAPTNILFIQVFDENKTLICQYY